MPTAIEVVEHPGAENSLAAVISCCLQAHPPLKVLPWPPSPATEGPAAAAHDVQPTHLRTFGS